MSVTTSCIQTGLKVCGRSLSARSSGIHHWVSPKHLSQYVAEMTWRINRREFGEGERVTSLLAQVEGRLKYKTLICMMGKKLEPPLYLEMNPDEAFEWFIEPTPPRWKN